MIFDNLVQQMVQLKASDLYLKSDAKPMARVDGLLQPLTATPLGHVELEQVTKTILSPAQWEDFVHTRECNLSYKSATGDRFRLNAYFQMGALGVVMRKVSNEIPTMESLGLPLKLKEVALKKRGLFFVCGPTGSGKSTTLASVIDYRNASMANHIITIEDPIEYVYADKMSIVSQREVGIDTMSFENALKNTLREAPDVISIGEIRDLETAITAMTMSETGHLVFATLHASNTYQSLERLLSLFTADKEKQLLLILSMNLIGVFAQRLIPRKGTEGGRVVATEFLTVTPMIKELIMNHKISDMKEVLRRGGQDGIYSFDQNIFELYQQDLITAENALNFADNPNEVQMRMKGFAGAIRQV